MVEITYNKFDAKAAEKILFYVYALRDPRDQTIFYVGKGEENRWYDHIHEARTDLVKETLKLDTIRQIEAAGLKVEAFILRSGITNEKFAYDVEGAVLHAFRLLERSGKGSGLNLTNIAEAHHPERGLVSVEVAQSMFNAQRAPEIDFPCVLLRLPKLWYPEMSDSQLQEATEGWWDAKRVKNGKERAEYAFAVSKGVIRGAYKIDSSLWRERVEPDRDWQNDIGKPLRWGFPGSVPAADKSDFLNKSVKHLFKKGDAHPVKFLNCCE
jgi:hypothetical protein